MKKGRQKIRNEKRPLKDKKELELTNIQKNQL